MSYLPSGPRIPSLLQLIYWVADPLNFLERCAKRYGDTFTLRLANFEPFVLMSNPQGVQEILSVDARQFDAGRGNDIVEPLVGANSLIVLDGDRHRRDRKLLMPSFHGESIRTYSDIICQITEQVASQWQVGQPFEARAAMQEITLEVILQAVFGLAEGDRYEQLKPLLAAMLNMFDSPLRSSPLFFPWLQKKWGAWSPWQQFQQRQQRIRALLQAEIEERRACHSSGTDVLSLMMAARDEQGEAMTDEELQDELLTLLIAGHETTATALAWAFYWICQHPQVQDKLLQELDGVEDPMAIARLPYLTAVCQETLRIYPVVPVTFPRIARSEVEVMGHQYEANTLFFPCIYLIHHRKDLYPDSKQFRPERFLERQYSAYEFLPFGGGNRRCLGAALAMLEMTLVLATVLSRYQLALRDNKPIKAARRGLTIAPANEVPLVVTGDRVSHPSTQATVSSI
ncbi:MAG: cytochrome P450 [Cyanophyceae cyanobacterium]